ncbi:winged helix-turn-helix domain-containing protein [Amycolatopsis sp. cmx-8-4]|uniref:winged helix-turn-helix domain-containing protein n=1 Tax=Amycolatopsis sp. cmx-8-4 TaxID=2790947 RepID=UPI00397BEF7F
MTAWTDEVWTDEARPAVELTVAVRIRIDPGHAAGLTARLLESFEDTLGVRFDERPDAQVVDLATRRPAVRIEAGSRRVLVRGTALELTRLEFELLLFLGRHPDVVFSRRTLLTEVWGSPHHGGERTVDVHVRKLRHKFEPEPAPITTVRGVGYRFDSSAEVIVV